MSAQTPRTTRHKPKAAPNKMAAGPPTPGNEAVLAALSEEMVSQISRNVTAALDERLVKLQVAMEEIKEGFEGHSRRLDLAENRISSQEDLAAQLERRVGELTSQNAKLMDRIEDQENRQRRNNIRILGLPESIGDADLQNTVEVWLPEQLGLHAAKDAPVCERVHRVGRRTEDMNRPRPVMARILNWQHKTTIMRAYREVKSLSYDGQKILLFHDYSALVASQRREMAPICTALYKKGVPCALLFPAKLRVTLQGKTRFFSTKREAQAFLDELQ